MSHEIAVEFRDAVGNVQMLRNQEMADLDPTPAQND